MTARNPRPKARKSHDETKRTTKRSGGNFHIDFKNDAQSLAYAAFKQHDVLFMIGRPGTGKTHLACAFAIEQIINGERKKIVLTRPIVEAGESLGFLPGEFDQKVEPYMMPMYDCLEKLVGREGPWRDKVNHSLEVAPLAYMRGRSGADSESIVTPDGTTTFGKVAVGDLVSGSDGRPTKVLAVYPQGEIPVYRMVFTDGTEVRCSGDHLWPTMTPNEKGYSIKTTNQIRATLRNSRGQKVHSVPFVSAPVHFEHKEVPIDPYVLGCLLGDGHLGNSVSFSSIDREILDEMAARLPEGNELVPASNRSYRIKLNGNGLLRNYLESVGLRGRRSHEKFVPEEYKVNSPEVRLGVLQGLMDTDGTIGTHRSGKCRIRFCSTSERLAGDVAFLVRSLGGYAHSRTRSRDGKACHPHNGRITRLARDSYIVDIVMEACPFRLARKAAKHVNPPRPTKMVSDVLPCGTESCTCIRVEAEDRLFLANGFNVTHNTFDDAICIFDEAQNASMMQLKMFLSRFGENSKLVITGDPTQSDLAGKVAMLEVIQRLRGLEGVGIVEFKANSIVRHPLIGKILERLEHTDGPRSG